MTASTQAQVINPVAVATAATLTRASVGNVWDIYGALVSKAINEARYQWNPATGTFEGVLWEPARTNLFLNSATLSTQTRSVSNGSVYTVSFYGTGSITITGTTTVGGVSAASRVLTGTGSTARATLTFTAGASSLTFTVSGGVTKANLELGSFATSWITTTGASASRSAEVFSGEGMFNTTFTDSTAAYAGGTAYAIGDQVQYSRRIYESLQPSNTGHTPTSTADDWNAVATYALGAQVLYDDQVYTSLQNGNVNKTPTDEPTWWTAWWLDVKPSNDFAMFDRTQDEASIGANGQQLFSFYTASEVNGVVLFNVQADTVHLAVSNGAGGLATQSVTVSGGVAVFLDLDVPGGTTGGAVVSVYAVRASGVVTIGEFIAGTRHGLGDPRLGLRYSIVDYSKKVEDGFGRTKFKQGRYAKRITAQLWIDTPTGSEDLNNIKALLEYLRSSPSAWVFSQQSKLAGITVVYGSYSDFYISVDYQNAVLCGLEILGLT